MEPVYIKENIWRHLFLLIVFLLADYLCIRGAIGEIPIKKVNPLFFQIICIIGILLFSMPILWLIFKSFNIKRPLLIITREGFVDNASFISVGFVDWSNVKKIYIEKSKQNTRGDILVELINTELLLKKLPFLKKIFTQLTIKLFTSSIVDFRVAIWMKISKSTSHEVLEIMQKYKAEYDRLHKAKKLNNDD